MGKTLVFQSNAGPPTLKDKKPKLSLRVVGRGALANPRLERSSWYKLFRANSSLGDSMHGYAT